MADGALGSAFPGNLQPAGPAKGSLDAIWSVVGFDREVPVGPHDPVPQGSSIVVRGWALHADETSGAGEVVVTLGDARAAAALVGVPRVDVAAVLNRPDLDATGFVVRIPTDGLAQGHHPVTFHVVDRQSGTYRSGRRAGVRIGPPAQSGPRRDPGRMRFTVEEVRDEFDDGGTVAEGAVRTRSVALVDGVVVDAKLDAAAGEIFVAVDGHTVVRGLYGYERPELAGSAGAPPPRYGFKARFSTRGLGPGRHAFRIIAVSADRSVYDESAAVPFDVIATD